jgi:hypothetical protein
MRYFLIILALACAGCRSAQKHAELAKWHLDKAIAKGAEVKEIQQIKWDTMFIERIQDRIVYVPTVDTSKLGVLCAELLAASQPPVTPNTAGAVRGKRPRPPGDTVKDIQKTVCPEIRKDTTYKVPVTVDGKRYDLPVHLQMASLDGRFSYALETGEVEVPYKTSETTLQVKGKRPTWWDFIIFAGFCAFMGFIAGRVTRRA